MFSIALALLGDSPLGTVRGYGQLKQSAWTVRRQAAYSYYRFLSFAFGPVQHSTTFL